MANNRQKRLYTLLIKKDLRQVDIAAKLGVHRSNVNKVIRGKKKTPRIQSAIARELGVPKSEIFTKVSDAA